MADERLTIREAAVRLGVSEGAIRKRIDRGTLRNDKDSDGRIYVYVDAGDTSGTTSSTTRESSALISQMQSRIDSLERQLEEAQERDRENRRLLAAALERIPPQLEAPAEPRESPETTTVGEAEPRPGGVQEGTQRPWWRRIFEG